MPTLATTNRLPCLSRIGRCSSSILRKHSRTKPCTSPLCWPGAVPRRQVRGEGQGLAAGLVFFRSTVQVEDTAQARLLSDRALHCCNEGCPPELFNKCQPGPSARKKLRRKIGSGPLSNSCQLIAGRDTTMRRPQWSLQAWPIENLGSGLTPSYPNLRLL